MTNRARTIARAFLIAAALALVAWAILRTAWVADDAYITLRTIDNWVRGHGLRWNVDERVQAYTHPLWMLVLAAAYAITREPMWTSALVGGALSLAAVALLVLRARAWWTIAWIALVCAGSRTFLSYATSGLENPLTHLLLAWFLVTLLKPGEPDARRFRRLCIAAGLMCLNRLDTVLLFGPPLVFAMRSIGWKRALPSLAIGFAPMFAWELFSIVYYGFWFPNTAYAKLSTGIPEFSLLRQGAWYFAVQGGWDAVASATLVLGVAISLARGGDARMAAIGVVASLAYVAWIGGDFMCGRFFAAPMIACVALLADCDFRGARALVLAIVPALAFFSTAPEGLHKWMNAKARVYSEHGVVDERLFYYRITGLLLAQPRDPYLWDFGRKMREDPFLTRVEPCIGIVGFSAGPTVHIIDNYALADALLARLPVAHPESFRVGHFERALPDGYYMTIATGYNRLRAPKLARYWDDLALVTRAPLFSRRRLAALWRIHTVDESLLRGAPPAAPPPREHEEREP